MNDVPEDLTPSGDAFEAALRGHLDGLLGGTGAGLAGDAAPALVRTARRRQRRARAVGGVAAVVVAAIAVAGGTAALSAGGPAPSVPAKIGPAPATPAPAVGYLALKLGATVTLPAGVAAADVALAGKAWSFQAVGAARQAIVGVSLYDGSSAVLTSDVPADTSPLAAQGSVLAYVQRGPGGTGLQAVFVEETTGRSDVSVAIPGAAGDPRDARTVLSPLGALVSASGRLTLLNQHSRGVIRQLSAVTGQGVATPVGFTGTGSYLLLRGGHLQLLSGAGFPGVTSATASGDAMPQVVNDTVTTLAGGTLARHDEDSLEVDATAQVPTGTSRGLVNGGANAVKGVVVTVTPAGTGAVLLQRRDQDTLKPVGAAERVTLPADATGIALAEGGSATLVLRWTSGGRVQARSVSAA